MGLFERNSKGRLYRISISTRSHYQAEFCMVIPQFSLVWDVSLWVDVISLTTTAQFCSDSLQYQLNRECISSLHHFRVWQQNLPRQAIDSISWLRCQYLRSLALALSFVHLWKHSQGCRQRSFDVLFRVVFVQCPSISRFFFPILFYIFKNSCHKCCQDYS